MSPDATVFQIEQKIHIPCLQLNFKTKLYA